MQFQSSLTNLVASFSGQESHGKLVLSSNKQTQSWGCPISTGELCVTSIGRDVVSLVTPGYSWELGGSQLTQEPSSDLDGKPNLFC